jgi:hypothetical protein
MLGPERISGALGGLRLEDRGRHRRRPVQQLGATPRIVQHRLEQLPDHAVGEVTLVLAAAGAQDEHLPLCSHPGGRLEQRGLAGTGLAFDRQHSSIVGDGCIQRPPDRPELLVSLQQLNRRHRRWRSYAAPSAQPTKASSPTPASSPESARRRALGPPLEKRTGIPRSARRVDAGRPRRRWDHRQWPAAPGRGSVRSRRRRACILLPPRAERRACSPSALALGSRRAKGTKRSGWRSHSSTTRLFSSS